MLSSSKDRHRHCHDDDEDNDDDYHHHRHHHLHRHPQHHHYRHNHVTVFVGLSAQYSKGLRIADRLLASAGIFHIDSAVKPPLRPRSPITTGNFPQTERQYVKSYLTST